MRKISSILLVFGSFLFLSCSGDERARVESPAEQRSIIVELADSDFAERFAEVGCMGGLCSEGATSAENEETPNADIKNESEGGETLAASSAESSAEEGQVYQEPPVPPELADRSECDPTSSVVGGGSGSQDRPLLICDPSHWSALNIWPSRWFEMRSDIRFDRKGEIVQRVFSGQLNGKGHVIKGIKRRVTDGRGWALFERISETGRVHHLRLEKAELISEGSQAGPLALVAKENRGQIDHLHLKGIKINDTRTVAEDSSGVFHQEVGGVVAVNRGVIRAIKIEELEIDLRKSRSVGGLVGRNFQLIEDIVLTGRVHVWRGDLVGGVVGSQQGGIVQDVLLARSSAPDKVSARKNRDISVRGRNFVGGVVGDFFRGTIQRVHVAGRVHGESDVGGVAGTLFEGTLRVVRFVGQTIAWTRFGGAVGSMNHLGAVLESAYITAIVTTDPQMLASIPYTVAGGAVGVINQGRAEDVQVEGTLQSEVTGEIGGLVGVSGRLTEAPANAYISQSTSSMDLYGSGVLGGLVARNDGLLEDSVARNKRIECFRVNPRFETLRAGGIGINRGRVSRIFSASEFSGSTTCGKVRALVGEGGEQQVVSSYWNSAGLKDAVSFGGEPIDVPKGWGMSELKGWDFHRVWMTKEKTGGPKLRGDWRKQVDQVSLAFAAKNHSPATPADHRIPASK